MDLCARRCDQCLFSKSRIVTAKRKAQIVAECVRTDTHFICHKTKDAACRGFYETHPGVGQLLRIMGRLGAIEEVEP